MESVEQKAPEQKKEEKKKQPKQKKEGTKEPGSVCVTYCPEMIQQRRKSMWMH